jgi:hypothetical protein
MCVDFVCRGELGWRRMGVGFMKSETRQWTDETVPNICWDRGWSVGGIAQRLKDAEGEDRHRLMAWLMTTNY